MVRLALTMQCNADFKKATKACWLESLAKTISYGNLFDLALLLKQILQQLADSVPKTLLSSLRDRSLPVGQEQSDLLHTCDTRQPIKGKPSLCMVSFLSLLPSIEAQLLSPPSVDGMHHRLCT